MGLFLDAWQSSTPLERHDLIPLIRSFTTAVLRATAIATGLSPEVATRMARYGEVQGDSYKRGSLRVEGLWLYFKQFKPTSDLFDRILVTLDPPLGGDWCLAIRVNTEPLSTGFRIKNVVAGLLRWGAPTTGIDERIVSRATELASAAGIELTATHLAEDEGRRWGAYRRLSAWAGSEEELIADFGRLLATLLPLLIERRTWSVPEPRRFVTARFSSLSGPVSGVLTPGGGGWELKFSERDARQLVGYGPTIKATLGAAAVRLLLTREGESYRNLTSCEGAYGTIGDLGAAMGLSHGDRVWFVQGEGEAFSLERAPVPDLLIPASAVGDQEPEAETRLEFVLPRRYSGAVNQWLSGWKRGEQASLYLTDGERVTHRATAVVEMTPFAYLGAPAASSGLKVTVQGFEPYELELESLRIADSWDPVRSTQDPLPVYDRALAPAALRAPSGRPPEPYGPKTLEAILEAFAAEPSLVYAEADLINLHTALTALPHKHFVILHGPSGTGKSQFAQAYANAIYGRPLRAPGNPYYKAIPVQPTWQDRGPLLGYFNPLTGRYEVPDFLAHLLKAAEDQANPYILCLDEMNLAVAEHYFADFLSAWESREPITLHRQGAALDLPETVAIPPNLYVIGTVNIDETTHSFSPKVLDRAFPVELSGQDLSIVIDRLIEGHGEVAPALRPVGNLLRELQAILEPEGLGFAYRTAQEILAFLAQLARAGWPIAQAEAIDRILHQKILPKLRGDDRRVRALAALDDRIRRALQEAGGDPEQSRSRSALARMRESAERYGTFQFWG